MRIKRQSSGGFEKLLIFIVAALIFVFSLLLFFRWLYGPEKQENLGKIEDRMKIAEYDDNIYIEALGSVITTSKVSLEGTYGVKMQGVVSRGISRAFKNVKNEMGNPMTYIKLACSAFGEAFPVMTANADNKRQAAIKDFKDVPQGEILFGEEDLYSHETGRESVEATTNSAIVIDIQTTTGSAIDADVEDPEKIVLADKNPQILIYHSHATESYMPNTESNYRTLNEKLNVVSVGAIMAKTLQQEYRYRVIHDKTYHDKESYAYSYINSLETIKKHMAAHKSLKVVLDVHRDGFIANSDADKKRKKDEYTVTIDGKKAAKVMLVIAQGNPNYNELEKFAVYIKKKMDKLYPGLFLKIDRKKTGKYNQYFSNYSMLIEVGCMLNTHEEAKYTAELMGKVLGEVLKDLKE